MFLESDKKLTFNLPMAKYLNIFELNFSTCLVYTYFILTSNVL